MFTITDAQLALKKVFDTYGADIAGDIERLSRLETGHYKSIQYQQCANGGMEAHGAEPYYGWNPDFFDKHPDFKPVGVFSAKEGKGLSEHGGNAQQAAPKQFVRLPSVDAWFAYLIYYMKAHESEGGLLRWYSRDKFQQDKYRQVLKGIIPHIVNSFV